MFPDKEHLTKFNEGRCSSFFFVWIFDVYHKSLFFLTGIVCLVFCQVSTISIIKSRTNGLFISVLLFLDLPSELAPGFGQISENFCFNRKTCANTTKMSFLFTDLLSFLTCHFLNLFFFSFLSCFFSFYVYLLSLRPSEEGKRNQKYSLGNEIRKSGHSGWEKEKKIARNYPVSVEVPWKKPFCSARKYANYFIYLRILTLYSIVIIITLSLNIFIYVNI